MSLTRFIIHKELGSGVYSRVYLAHDKETKREVAIKIITPQHTRTLEKPLNREFLLGRQCHLICPRVVSYVESLEVILPPWTELPRDWHHERCRVMVMNYVNGHEIQDLAYMGREMDPDQCLEMLIQLAEIVQTLHQNNLIHGDINLSNIMHCPSLPQSLPKNPSPSESLPENPLPESLVNPLPENPLPESSPVSPPESLVNPLPENPPSEVTEDLSESSDEESSTEELPSIEILKRSQGEYHLIDLGGVADLTMTLKEQNYRIFASPLFTHPLLHSLKDDPTLARLSNERRIALMKANDVFALIIVGLAMINHRVITSREHQYMLFEFNHDIIPTFGEYRKKYKSQALAATLVETLYFQYRQHEKIGTPSRDYKDAYYLTIEKFLEILNKMK